MRRASATVTVTDTVRLAEPPAPEQLKAYEASALSGPMDSDPDVTFVPDQPPEAVHEVASVEDQVSVTDEPDATDEALDVKLTVGGVGGLSLPLPPLPPHALRTHALPTRMADHAVRSAPDSTCRSLFLDAMFWGLHEFSGPA